MKAVVAYLVFNPEKNQYGACHANNKSRNIDCGKSFVAKQVAPGNFEVILEHKRDL
jgi:hypothetical protein